MSKNGMASYQKPADYVNLTRLPTPKKEYITNFERLTGGLNLYDPDYRLKTNESPDMENMLWKNGTLCSRYGQDYVDVVNPAIVVLQSFVSLSPFSTVTLSERASDIVSVNADNVRLPTTAWSWDYDKTITLETSAREVDVQFVPLGRRTGEGYTCFSELFWDNAFFHIGTKLFYGEPSDNMTLTDLCDLRVFYGDDFAPSRGTFLRYGDDLFYKARGVFVRIHYTGNASAPFTVSDVSATAYTPITYINCNWQNGAGDAYQPENRLSAKKTLWYNAGTSEQTEEFSGDGSETQFTITLSDFVYVTDVTVDGATVGNWTVSGTTLTFYSAPAAGTDNIVVKCQCAVKTYTLPVVATAINEVKVDGVVTSDYTYSDGVITFTSAPTVTVPASSNTIEVTYTLANTAAFNSVMDCPYAIVYGGNQNICMVVGGCTAQPNAFFWNGNNIVMDVSYWPMEQYNLGGDTEDAITGFGRQQGNLIVFKNRSVGKVSMEFTTVDSGTDGVSRVYIEMDYTSINSKMGCDLPWSIQLVENNLVFCNTQQGVHFIQDSSAAYENNIICLSTKVNGDNGRAGLLQRVRDAELVSSFDDDHRYWVIADTHVFCWDYELSDQKNPSWFYLTGIDAPALFMDVDTIYHIDKAGRVIVFDNSYADFGEGFERRYQFATQYFGTYDRLKTVTSAIFTLRPDTDFRVRVTYLTDYEQRDDLTDIVCRSWRLSPRNLRWRDLTVYPFAYVARRRPGCRHIRHFSTVLRCDGAGYDMPLLSAQVMHKFEGRDR